jgi:hypothetical protein
MNRYLLILLASLLSGVLALHTHAQKCGANAQTPISTDRPQVTNSSIVVPCGSLQFENGIQQTGNPSQRSIDLPETSVRLGIANKTELRLAAPDYFFNTTAVSSLTTSSAFATGLGDTIIGLKQQLGPQKGFDFSLIPSLSLPTGANLISSHGYDPSLQLPWSRSLSKNWTAAGMFSLADPTVAARRNLTGQSSLYFDRQLTAPWDAYVEYSDTSPQRGGPQQLIDIGTAWKPSPHQQLDLRYTIGLSAATPSHAIGFGYSFRFQAFRSS